MAFGTGRLDSRFGRRCRVVVAVLAVVAAFAADRPAVAQFPGGVGGAGGVGGFRGGFGGGFNAVGGISIDAEGIVRNVDAGALESLARERKKLLAAVDGPGAGKLRKVSLAGIVAAVLRRRRRGEAGARGGGAARRAGAGDARLRRRRAARRHHRRAGRQGRGRRGRQPRGRRERSPAPADRGPDPRPAVDRAGPRSGHPVLDRSDPRGHGELRAAHGKHEVDARRPAATLPARWRTRSARRWCG